VYLTDSGLLHAFLGIETARQLDVSPQRGASWEGFVIEQIIRREKLAHPDSQFYFWRTAKGLELDLVNQSREKYAPFRNAQVMPAVELLSQPKWDLLRGAK
jgi:hypothetical protein